MYFFPTLHATIFKNINYYFEDNNGTMLNYNFFVLNFTTVDFYHLDPYSSETGFSV